MARILLITPPFTQLNTPYPATAYLKGFLNTRYIGSRQTDLGIELINQIFSSAGLQGVFDAAITARNKSANANRIIALREEYKKTIDAVVSFLQGANPTLAHQICTGDFLPEASRFEQARELEWAFGSMGVQDKAKHLATLYLEDISDLIVECVDANFGFSRYAERLGRSATTFDELYESLCAPETFTDRLLPDNLQKLFDADVPELVLISVPFPGNLYSAFRCASWIRQHHPSVHIAMGGGFANTELRSLSDPRVFEFFHYICLDDGEAPIENLLEYLEGKRRLEQLKRTFTLVDGEVAYCNGSETPDYKQFETGTPDYSDLPLDKYISVIELVNPMHRMWSDGRWNKLTMAHGCYWGKCTFCDISLDYIRVYEPVAAGILCDRMEELIRQTGQTGFHFVDEAAPPALMRSLALEILRRGLTVTWWTNIRFEKSFTRDLCVLLRASGCVAISGGLEVASNRLLELIKKGVTVEQVARVTRNFTEAGIMVHAYLMYGFPTQTAQETIDSLEMVRQMFEEGVLQSGFWHQFAMTAHSPVGLDPQKFNVRSESACGPFANNDMVYFDPTGTDHERFSYGLKKSLFNYMHGLCFDEPLQFWFDHRVPKTTIQPDFIARVLEMDTDLMPKPDFKLVWLGGIPTVSRHTKNKKGRQMKFAELRFSGKKADFTVTVDPAHSTWLCRLLEQASPSNANGITYSKVKESFERETGTDFEPFWYGKAVHTLRKWGLLVV